jgi:NAD(P)H-dependent flavin oxidoreductase YrpB (nitropropane dioxygenase family)
MVSEQQYLAKLAILVGPAYPHFATARKKERVRLARNGLGHADVFQRLHQRGAPSVHLIAVPKLAKLVAAEGVALAVVRDADRVARAGPLVRV